MKNHAIIKRLATASVLAALYLALCYLDISFGRFKITLAAIVPIFAALALPVPDCFITCILGVFLNQLFYGLSPTTIIWMIPPLLRPIVISPVSHHMYKRGRAMEDYKVLTIVLIMISSVLVSICNSGALYLDSIIMGYPYKAVILNNIFQVLITIATGIAEAFLIFPLLKALRKTNFLPSLKNRKLNILTSEIETKF